MAETHHGVECHGLPWGEVRRVNLHIVRVAGRSYDDAVVRVAHEQGVKRAVVVDGAQGMVCHLVVRFIECVV